VGPRNYVLDRDQHRMNAFAAMMGNKSVMQPFTNLLWTVVSFSFLLTDLLLWSKSRSLNSELKASYNSTVTTLTSGKSRSTSDISFPRSPHPT